MFYHIGGYKLLVDSLNHDYLLSNSPLLDKDQKARLVHSLFKIFLSCSPLVSSSDKYEMNLSSKIYERHI